MFKRSLLWLALAAAAVVAPLSAQASCYSCGGWGYAQPAPVYYMQPVPQPVVVPVPVQVPVPVAVPVPAPCCAVQQSSCGCGCGGGGLLGAMFGGGCGVAAAPAPMYAQPAPMYAQPAPMYVQRAPRAYYVVNQGPVYSGPNIAVAPAVEQEAVMEQVEEEAPMVRRIVRHYPRRMHRVWHRPIRVRSRD